MLEQSKAKMATEAGSSASSASVPALASSINMVKLDKRTGVFRIPVTDKWQISGSTQVKIRSSRTTLCVLGLLCILIATGVVLNFRIHKLESKNSALEGALDRVNTKLGCLMAKMSSLDVDVDHCVEFEEQLALLSAAAEKSDQNGQQRGPRIRKSVDYNQGQNLAQVGDDEELKNNSWNASAAAETAALKGTALTPRNPQQYRKREREARAAYLTVRDPAINIRNPKQHIGPWHLVGDGSDLGFNDLWYQNLALDDNGTSVVFQEGGLYLIYAQVYYRSTQTKKDKAASLGFRIYLKKKPRITEVFKQPIPISECVAAYPSYFQTCFTQTCWYIGEGDEVYLEHFSESKPVIEAENQGQTFLGVVRLS